MSSSDDRDDNPPDKNYTRFGFCFIHKQKTMEITRTLYIHSSHHFFGFVLAAIDVVLLSSSSSPMANTAKWSEEEKKNIKINIFHEMASTTSDNILISLFLWLPSLLQSYSFDCCRHRDTKCPGKTVGPRSSTNCLWLCINRLRLPSVPLSLSAVSVALLRRSHCNKLWLWFCVTSSETAYPRLELWLNKSFCVLFWNFEWISADDDLIASLDGLVCCSAHSCFIKTSPNWMIGVHCASCLTVGIFGRRRRCIGDMMCEYLLWFTERMDDTISTCATCASRSFSDDISLLRNVFCFASVIAGVAGATAAVGLYVSTRRENMPSAAHYTLTSIFVLIQLNILRVSWDHTFILNWLLCTHTDTEVSYLSNRHEYALASSQSEMKYPFSA